MTAQMAKATASAPRGPKRAANASAPRHAEIERVELEREASPRRPGDHASRPRCPSRGRTGHPAPAYAVSVTGRPQPTGRKLEEARSARRVGRVAALQLWHGLRNAREWLVVVAVLRDRDERNTAVSGHQKRLGARAEDAVSPLQLGAVHGEIGLVDERVRILCVCRKGDTIEPVARIGRSRSPRRTLAPRSRAGSPRSRALFRRPPRRTRTPRRRKRAVRRNDAAGA